MSQRKSGWGLFTRRECLLPTWRGWIVLLLAVAVLTIAGVKGAYPFLALNDPINEGALVVEGWMPDDALRRAIAEFNRGHFSKIFVTGGPLERGAPLSEYQSFAELSAATLLRLGAATNAVQAVPAPMVRVDRTYTSALALRNWVHEHGYTETNFNVISLGPHSRRSRMLFEKALGTGCKVGIIAVDEPGYDSARWWKSSEGVRSVIGEMIAYIYARVSSWL